MKPLERGPVLNIASLSVMCAICLKSRSGDFEGLDELAANESKHTYLCGCPHCGTLWMGHGFSPQLMMELTRAEAATEFPTWRPSDMAR